MADISPVKLLDLYWKYHHEPKKVWIAVPKAGELDPARMILWGCLRDDLSRRVQMLPNPDSYDIFQLAPPERRTP